MDLSGAAGVLLLAAALGCGGAAATRDADDSVGDGNAPDGSVGGRPGSDGGSPGDTSASSSVVLVPIESRETIADPGKPILYLAATTNSPMNPNSVVALSTTTGAVVWATPLPFEPGHIAVADDGSTLYVTAWLPGTQVARLNLSTHALELMLSLSTSPDGGGQFLPDDVTMIAGAPHSVIVSMRDNVVVESAVAVFDDATMRPHQQVDLGQSRMILHMGGAGMLYGLAYGGGFVAFTVDEQGLGPPIVGAPPGDLGPYAKYFSFDGELIVSNDGIVLDPRTGTRVGMYDGDPAATAIDRSSGRTYLAMPPSGSASGPLVVVECDHLTFAPLRRLTLGYQGEPFRMVRAMDGTLALDAHLDENELLLIPPSAWNGATQP
jgi:hypothetical protein